MATARVDTAFSRGDVMRRLHDLENAVKALGTARALEASTIGAGGITVNQGGRIRIIDDVVTGSEVVLGEGAMSLLPGAMPGAVPGLVFASAALPGVPSLILIPPHEDEASANFLFIGGKGGGAPGQFGVIAAGDAQVNAGTNAFVVGGSAIVISAPSVFISHPTTADAANARLDPTTGLLQRSTSSARYKVDIEDLAVDADAVLRLRPRVWRDRAEVEADPDTPRRHVGLVAEEVAEHLPAFVEYAAEGGPDAVAYDRLAVALLAVVQDQAQRIAALEAAMPEVRSAVEGRTTRTGRSVGARLPGAGPVRPTPSAHGVQRVAEYLGAPSVADRGRRIEAAEARHAEP